ncbi:hypothetical protein DPMN_151623 [Dreissena polymorpha]|uniref:Uncharacterized protein n=1 Tax=Dreissena polymorpha TaxID=45954 RepID=A0A9D4J753_DREPO|nr:hypothetical protein DPMN_151623 [Dreissena polymorpha]
MASMAQTVNTAQRKRTTGSRSAIGKRLQSPSNSPGGQTPGNMQRSTEYNLTVNGNLAKKLEAANRTQCIECEVTGGGFVITADLTTFELLKTVSLYFYGNEPGVKNETTIDTTYDKSGKNIVMYAIRHTSYTLNIYNTRSRFLINGKNVPLFIDDHLKQIQRLVQQVRVDGRPVDVASTNKQLAESIESAMRVNKPAGCVNQNTTSKTRLSIQKSADNTVSTDKVKEKWPCIKCKINVKNGVECSKNHTGKSHWIHYNCLKRGGVSEEELKNLMSQSQETAFTCVVCIKHMESQVNIENSVNSSSNTKTNTNDTQKTSNDTNPITYQQLLVIPSRKKSALEDSVKALVLEESNRNETPEITETCYVCSKTILSNETCCDICNAICHLECVNYDSVNLKVTCITCIGTTEQLEAASQEDMAEQVNDGRTQSVTATAPDANQGDKLKAAQGLKQKEQKLKKLETDLKIREKEISEAAKHRPKLENHIKKLEARTEELDRLNRTLLDKIEFLENQIETLKKTAPTVSSSTNKCSNPALTENEKLMDSIHSKVTNFILKQIDKQLENLDLNKGVSSTVTSDNETRTSHVQNNEPFKDRDSSERILKINNIRSRYAHNVNNSIVDRAEKGHHRAQHQRNSENRLHGDIILPEGYVAVPRDQVYATTQGRPICKTQTQRESSKTSVKASLKAPNITTQENFNNSNAPESNNSTKDTVNDRHENSCEPLDLSTKKDYESNRVQIVNCQQINQNPTMYRSDSCINNIKPSLDENMKTTTSNNQNKQNSFLYRSASCIDLT